MRFGSLLVAVTAFLVASHARATVLTLANVQLQPPVVSVQPRAAGAQSDRRSPGVGWIVGEGVASLALSSALFISQVFLVQTVSPDGSAWSFFGGVAGLSLVTSALTSFIVWAIDRAAGGRSSFLRIFLTSLCVWLVTSGLYALYAGLANSRPFDEAIAEGLLGGASISIFTCMGGELIAANWHSDVPRPSVATLPVRGPVITLVSIAF